MRMLNDTDIVFLSFLGVFVILNVVSSLLPRGGVPNMPNPPSPPHLKSKH